MACLETSFLIDLLRGKTAVNELKDELDRNETRLTIAAPSIMELWAGSYAVKGIKAEQDKILELIESLELLPLDSRSAREAGEIEASLSAKGIEIQTEDVMIAGIARINGEKVVTRDNGYGCISGLKVLKY